MSNIQGFLYGHKHVIRDLNKPPAEQVIWEREGDYEKTHAAMMDEIDRLQMEPALATLRARIAELEAERDEAIRQHQQLLESYRTFIERAAQDQDNLRARVAELEADEGPSFAAIHQMIDDARLAALKEAEATARKTAQTDHEVGVKYPDEAERYTWSAHRAVTIADAIAALAQEGGK